MTLKVVLAMRWLRLVAVQVTTVTPGGKQVPEGGTHATLTPQKSVAAGGMKTPMPHGWPAGIGATTGPWLAITGGTDSNSVNGTLHIELLPDWSVTVTVIVRGVATRPPHRLIVAVGCPPLETRTD
jgi:hypothetical protein